MSKGLAKKHHELKKAKARAVKHFKAVFTPDNKWWDNPRAIGKQAVTKSLCGTSGCKVCAASAYFSYTSDWHKSKVSYIEE